MPCDILNHCIRLRLCYHRANKQHFRYKSPAFLVNIMPGPSTDSTSVLPVIPAPPLSQIKSRFNFYVALDSLKVMNMVCVLEFTP